MRKNDETCHIIQDLRRRNQKFFALEQTQTAASTRDIHQKSTQSSGTASGACRTMEGELMPWKLVCFFWGVVMLGFQPSSGHLKKFVSFEHGRLSYLLSATSDLNFSFKEAGCHL